MLFAKTSKIVSSKAPIRNSFSEILDLERKKAVASGSKAVKSRSRPQTGANARPMPIAASAPSQTERLIRTVRTCDSPTF